MKIIVDRRTWYRGQGSDSSYLLTFEGDENASNERLCCVGFVCRAMHYNDSLLRGVQTIAKIDGDDYCDPFPKDWLQQSPSDEDASSHETPEFFELYKINDDEIITDEEREAALIMQAHPLGIEFEFVN